MNDIDYEQLIKEMQEDNERQQAEWRKEVLNQFELKGECEYVNSRRKRYAKPN